MRLGPLADIQVTLVDAESVRLGCFWDHTHELPVLPIESKHRSLVIAGRIECIVENSQCFDPLSVWGTAWCPALTSVVSKEAGRSVERTGVELASKDDQRRDCFGLRGYRAAILPLIGLGQAIHFATQGWVLGL